MRYRELIEEVDLLIGDDRAEVFVTNFVCGGLGTRTDRLKTRLVRKTTGENNFNGKSLKLEKRF